jgi:hypothetical protein
MAMKTFVAAIAIAAALVATAGAANATHVKLDTSATSPFRDAPAKAKDVLRRKSIDMVAATDEGFRRKSIDWNTAADGFRRKSIDMVAGTDEGFRRKSIDWNAATDGFRRKSIDFAA